MNLRVRVVGNVEAFSSSFRWTVEVRRLLEILPKSFVAPARISQLLPCIVVGICAPIKLHSVYDRAAANNVADMNTPCLILHEWLRPRCNIVIVVGVEASKVGNSGLGSVVDGTIFDDEDGYYAGQSFYKKCDNEVTYPSCSPTGDWQQPNR